MSSPSPTNPGPDLAFQRRVSGSTAESGEWSPRHPGRRLVMRQDREAFDAGLKAVLDEVRGNLAGGPRY
jgi:hypothetical protein